MSVYEAVYYGVAGIAVLLMLLLLYLVYASNVVFTSSNMAFKVFAYVTALLDSWFIGAISAALNSDDEQCINKDGN